MADLSLIVDYTQVKQANEAILAVGTTAQKSASVFEKAFKKVEASQRKALSDVKQQMAASKRLGDQKLKEANITEKAAQALAKEEERLKNKFVEGYTAMNIYTKELNDLAVARKKDIITSEQQSAAVEALNADMAAGTGAFKSYGSSVQQTRSRQSQLGVLFQQTGYQVGDFAVQVQSGQNAMVAFGQQATQLVGTFGMLSKSTKLIGLFAGLGIAIPILTAIGAALLRMKKANDEAGKAADSLAKKIESLDKVLADYKDTQDALVNGVSLDEYFSTKELDAAIKKLKEAKEDLKELTFGEALVEGGLRGLPLIGNLIAGETETEAYKAALKGVTDAEERLAKVRQKESEEQGKRFAEQKFSLDQELALQQAIFTLGKDSKGVKALELEQEIALRHRGLEAQRTSLELKGYDVDALKAQVAETLTLTAANENLGEQLLSHVELYQKALDKRKESQKSFDEQLYAQHQALTLLTIESELGKKSSAYRSELVAQEAERLQKLLDQKSITEDQAKEALALFETTLNVNDAIAKGADSAKSLADALKEAAAAMSSLSGFSNGLDKALAVSVAKVQALKSGTDAAIAGSIAGMRIDLEAKSSTALAAGADPIQVLAEKALGSSSIDALEESETQRKALEAANRGSSSAGAGGGGGGGKSQAEELSEYLQKKQEEAILQERLLGLFGEERDIQSELISAKEKYNGVMTTAQANELEATLRQIAADKERQAALEESNAQLQSVADTMQSSMSDAFMSMRKGTKSFKDAMEDMARAVIKQLFDILAVQQIVGSFDKTTGARSGIVGSIFSAFGFANGGAFSGGSQVKAYANGGVVGGPTYFPMSGGKTGLMGEAGPEAIMPLKRGANGKLGVQMEGSSGGDVNIVQNFSFQANGDDSVKKLIAQAAPQIAQMTQKQIMDSRRRGGAMKSTFG